MNSGKTRSVVVGTMLLFDAVVGMAVAVLVSPVVGAIAFVVSATISLLSSRVIRGSSSRGTDAPVGPEAEQPPAETPEPVADPSYNPYARED